MKEQVIPGDVVIDSLKFYVEGIKSVDDVEPNRIGEELLKDFPVQTTDELPLSFPPLLTITGAKRRVGGILWWVKNSPYPKVLIKGPKCEATIVINRNPGLVMLEFDGKAEFFTKSTPQGQTQG